MSLIVRRICINMALLALLVSCEDFTFTQVYRIDPRLEKYVDRFIYEANGRGLRVERRNLIAELSSDPNWVDKVRQGRCIQKSVQMKVLIYEPAFNDNTEARNEQLIFHELGHWIGLEHDDSKVDLIMNSATALDIYLTGQTERRRKALDEMFSKCIKYTILPE